MMTTLIIIIYIIGLYNNSINISNKNNISNNKSNNNTNNNINNLCKFYYLLNYADNTKSFVFN